MDYSANFLDSAAVVLVILWAICFIGFHIGGPIHLLLIASLISVIIKLSIGKKSF